MPRFWALSQHVTIMAKPVLEAVKVLQVDGLMVGVALVLLVPDQIQSNEVDLNVSTTVSINY